MRKALVLTLVLIFISALVSGCSLFGKAKELQDAAGEIEDLADQIEEIEENEDEQIFNAQVYTFDDSTDLLNTFQEFGYEWDEEGNSSSVEWEVIGEEEIDGVMTKHVLCSKFEYDETEEYEVWFNDEWLAVKAVVDGEEKEGWEAEGAGMLITMMAQTYVNYASLANVIFIDAGNPGVLDGSAYKLENKSSESISLGGGSNADLYRVKSLWVNSYWDLGLAKVGGKQLYVILKQGADDDSAGLVVTRAVAH